MDITTVRRDLKNSGDKHLIKVEELLSDSQLLRLKELVTLIDKKPSSNATLTPFSGALVSLIDQRLTNLEESVEDQNTSLDQLRDLFLKLQEHFRKLQSQEVKQ